MKTGEIIAGVLVTLGIGTAGYFIYKKYTGSAAAPAGALTPVGTTATGLQVYSDQAGKLIDQTGAIVSDVKSIIQSMSGKVQSTKPTALPADFNAAQYLINNPAVKNAKWDAAKHYQEYGYKEGRSWTAGDPVRLDGFQSLSGFLHKLN